MWSRSDIARWADRLVKAIAGHEGDGIQRVDLTPENVWMLTEHLKRWLAAAEMQAGRCRNDTADIDEAFADAHFFVNALFHVVAGAEWARAQLDDVPRQRVDTALSRFNQSAPDVADIRGVFEHPLEYEFGSGADGRPKKHEHVPTAPPRYIEIDEHGEVIIYLSARRARKGSYTLFVGRAAGAARSLVDDVCEVLAALP